jgi:hypothetical protein
MFRKGSSVPPRPVARRHAYFFLTLALAAGSMGALCEPPSTATQITRERAIEIAQQEVQWKPDKVEAERATSQGRDVWRVTFQRRLPDAPPGLFDTYIVEIDARTGEIVTVSISGELRPHRHENIPG